MALFHILCRLISSLKMKTSHEHYKYMIYQKYRIHINYGILNIELFN